jgi:hypothetical protein
MTAGAGLADTDQQLHDPAQDHDGGAEQVADEQAGAAGAVADQPAVERRAHGAEGCG